MWRQTSIYFSEGCALMNKRDILKTNLDFNKVHNRVLALVCNFTVDLFVQKSSMV